MRKYATKNSEVITIYEDLNQQNNYAIKRWCKKYRERGKLNVLNNSQEYDRKVIMIT